MPPESVSNAKLKGGEHLRIPDGFLKYPACRDDDFTQKSLARWLDNKQDDDGAEALWRIHDKLYDLDSFIDRHPGGREWLEVTRGTDITEAFESHHLSNTPKEILKDYYVREAVTPRNSPFTFKPDGFYASLKRKAADVLKRNGGSGPTISSKMCQDLLLVSFLTAMITTGMTGSYGMAVLSGMLLCLTMTCSHNFIHQKDNWRMYCCDLSLSSFEEYRISHILSHHMYPNTVLDWEITFLEPVYQFLPKADKTWLARFAPIITLHFTQLLVMATYIKKLIDIYQGKLQFRWHYLLAPLEIVVIAQFTPSLFTAVMLWLTMQLTYAYCFGIIGYTAAHHHPDIYHAGDAHRSDMDWGLHQLDAVKDRKEVDGNFFLVMVTFGNHSLHHLFPTVDHSRLHILQPALKETCKEFGIEYDSRHVWDMILGCFRQFARNKPNLVPPGANVGAPKSIQKKG